MTVTKGFIHTAATTALDTRKADEHKVVASAAGAPRLGVLTENPSIVTSDASTAPMRVAVAKAGFVTQRAAGDGVAFWTNDGSVFVTVTKPGSNSWYVRVWVKHNDAASGDGNSLPEIGTTTGTAAASPTLPALPAGVTELANVLIPSTATSTQSGGVVITNTYPMTAMRGGIVPLRNAAEQTAWTPADAGAAYRIDTDIHIVRAAGAWKAVNSGLHLLHAASFAAASTVVLDGLFSSLFDAYTIELECVAAVDTTIIARLRTGGVTDSATSYYASFLYGTGSAAAATQQNLNSRWQLSTMPGDHHVITLDLRGPADASVRTRGLVDHADWDTSIPNMHIGKTGIAHGAVAAQDGLIFITEGAVTTLTGKVRVYGRYSV